MSVTEEFGIKVGDRVMHVVAELPAGADPNSLAARMNEMNRTTVWTVVKISEASKRFSASLTIRDDSGRTFGAGPENVFKVDAK
jgi:hypothetical protein